MSDTFHAAVKQVSYNRGLFVALLGIAAIFTIHGCGLLEGKSTDPVTGLSATSSTIYTNVTKRVSEIEQQEATLAIEKNALIEAGNLAIEDADAKTDRNMAIANAVLESPQVQSLLAPITGGSLLLSAGLLFDNRRKNRIIQTGTQHAE